MKGQKTYLIDVHLVNKSSGQETLSYFSTVKILPGTLVKVPVRKKFVVALVLRSRKALRAKSDIRRAGFMLKKITQKDVLAASISRETLLALEKCAHYYALSLGSLLASFLPKIIIDEPELFLKPLPPKKKLVVETTFETLLLQMEIEERFGQYRALVRQAFARSASVMFVVPTHSDAERTKVELEKGIEEFVYFFSLDLKKSEIKSAWRDAREKIHPILFITTPAGLSFRRRDLDTIIVERENSRAYRTLSRPYFHYKVLIEFLSHTERKRLVLGESVLSLETLWREKNGEYGENSLIRWRLPGASTALVDAKSKLEENGRFEIFSLELKKLIKEALAENERVFLFGARKGLAPTTVCGECGTVLPCLNCGAPVVLHKHHEANIYLCHACRSMRDSTTVCGYCGSWKLVPLGIGTQEIARYVRELFPHTETLILDKDHAPTDAKARSIAKKFADTGGILVGTELAFFYLEKVAYSAIVSLDSLFSLPDFGINERIFYLVSRLREMTTKRAIVQTRNIGKQVLAWGTQGNIIDFYLSEIEDRRSLLYPPFSIFIKIIAPKAPPHELKNKFIKWHPDILKDSIVMRIPREKWPDEELIKELTLLGPQFLIKVDPESIL